MKKHSILRPTSLATFMAGACALCTANATIIIPVPRIITPTTPTTPNWTEIGTENIDEATMNTAIYAPGGGWVGSGSWNVWPDDKNAGANAITDGVFTPAKAGRSFIYGHMLDGGGADAGTYTFTTDITQTFLGDTDTAGLSVGNFSIWLTSSADANPGGSMDPTHSDAAAEFVGGANYTRATGLTWDFYDGTTTADVTGPAGTNTTLTSASFTIDAADTWMVIAFTQDPGIAGGGSGADAPATDFGTGLGNFVVTTVPEPSSLALLGLGGLGVLLRRRR